MQGATAQLGGSAVTNRLFVQRVEHDCVDDSPVGRLHTDYILSTNERGSAVIHKMMREFAGSLAGKRVLDIGSGYGGVSVGRRLAHSEDPRQHLAHWSTETDPERRERCARAIQNAYGVELGYFVLQRQ